MADGPPELLETLHTRFQEDLVQVFGERAQDFNEPLVNLLFEFWSHAAHSEMRLIPDEKALTKMVHQILADAKRREDGAAGISSQSLQLYEHSLRPNPPRPGTGLVWIKDHPNALMFTDETGYDHEITGAGADTNVGDALQKLYENGENPFQNAVASKGVSDAYMMVPVMMHKGTGQVFGVDLMGRNKYVPTQRIVHLTNNDGGYTWKFDVSYQPPSHQDTNATHVIIRVDGVVKTAPTDYTVNTTNYGNDEAVESIYMMLACPDAEVTATYPDVSTEYF
jgi:hypothetical protein